MPDNPTTPTTSVPTSNVHVIVCADGFSEAQRRAQEEASSTGGSVLPAILFQQGIRQAISTAFPLALVRSRLNLNAARPRAGLEDVRRSTNRPTMPEHVDTIKRYVHDNLHGVY